MFKNFKFTKDTLEWILAIFWSVSSMSFFFASAYGVFKGTETVQTALSEGLMNIVMLIIGFYFGSSSKSSSSTNVSNTTNTDAIVTTPLVPPTV